MSLLARKATATESDWHRVVAEIYADPDTDRARLMLATAAERVSRRLSPATRAFVGWSAGKDSLALGEVVAESGERLTSVIALSQLEFPSFIEYVREARPPRLIVEGRKHLDYNWLRDNERHAFPTTAAGSNGWYTRVQRAALRQFAAKTGQDLIVTGKRTVDGNHVGRTLSTGGAEYVGAGGLYYFSPIYDWSHEDLLNVLAYQGVELPFFYSWPRGFRVGTGPWPARRIVSGEDGWAEVAEIDPSVIERAARAGVTGAIDYLSRGN